jgi:hypothetical protein
MIKYGSCVPELPTSYKWGFSFLALWIFMLVSAVWTIGIYAPWLDAYLHSRLDRQPASKRVTGSYKVALSLAKAINQNFHEAVIDTLTNSALKKKYGGMLTAEYCPTRLCLGKPRKKNPAPQDTMTSTSLVNRSADGRSTGGFVLA